MCHYIESICIEKGLIYNLKGHNDRLNNTRKAIYGDVLPINLADFIDPLPHKLRTKCRVEYARDVINVSYAPYTLRPVSSLRLVTCNDINYSFKSTERSKLDKLFAMRGSEDDILIVKNNCLTDTSICNIALWNGSAWETPMYPLLKGTRRAQLLLEGCVTERDILVEELEKYSRIRLFNAMIEFGEIELELGQVK